MQIICGGQVIEVQSLGQPIDDAFARFYGASLGGGSFLWREFEDAARSFFDRDDVGPDEHNRYFENFNLLSELYGRNGQFDRAEDLWRRSIEPALAWENTNSGRRVHKGTAFYFWGRTAIIRGDLDRGYLLMHQAVDEDSKLGDGNFLNRPASALVTLDADNPRQAFRSWVLDQAQLLERSLAEYRSENGSSLTFSELRRRFLALPPNREVTVLFAYVVARMLKLENVPSYALRTPFTGQIELNLLFDLALVIDSAIKRQHPDPTKWKFIDLAEYVASRAALGIDRDDLKAANQRFKHDFGATASDLLANGFQLQNGSLPSPKARNLLLAYAIRNRGAHDITSPSIVGTKSAKFRGALFGTLFTVVETLY